MELLCDLFDYDISKGSIPNIVYRALDQSKAINHQEDLSGFYLNLGTERHLNQIYPLVETCTAKELRKWLKDCLSSLSNKKSLLRSKAFLKYSNCLKLHSSLFSMTEPEFEVLFVEEEKNQKAYFLKQSVYQKILEFW